MALQKNSKSHDTNDKNIEKEKVTEICTIDIPESEKEEERTNLSDSNILHYDVPSPSEEKILGMSCDLDIVFVSMSKI